MKAISNGTQVIFAASVLLTLLIVQSIRLLDTQEQLTWAKAETKMAKEEAYQAIVCRLPSRTEYVNTLSPMFKDKAITTRQYDEAMSVAYTDIAIILFEVFADINGLDLCQ